MKKKTLLALSTVVGVFFISATFSNDMLAIGQFRNPVKNTPITARVLISNNNWKTLNVTTNSNGEFTYPSSDEGRQFQCTGNLVCFTELTNGQYVIVT